MGKKAPRAPAAPDPQATAEAQQMAAFGPQGNILFGSTDEFGNFNPRAAKNAYQVQESPFTQRQRLGGESIADALMMQAAGLSNNPYQFQIDYGQVDPMMTQDAFNRIQTSAAQDYTNQALALLNPEFQRQDQSKQLELMNRGIPVGGEGANEAGTTALADLAKQQNTARQQVAFEGLSRGGAEAQRQLANALQRREYQIGDQLRNFDQNNAARDVGIQNFAGLLGLNINQAPRGPGAQYQNAGIVDSINQGYQAQLANAQNRAQARNQNIGGAFGLLGGLATFNPTGTLAGRILGF
ncbi:MAG: hypothetical protein EB059_09065 [Alphaproteobacteria bacterium]|nr:hypothetical protein [Alphaproteobacteria bacterium]